MWAYSRDFEGDREERRGQRREEGRQDLLPELRVAGAESLEVAFGAVPVDSPAQPVVEDADERGVLEPVAYSLLVSDALLFGSSPSLALRSRRCDTA